MHHCRFLLIRRPERPYLPGWASYILKSRSIDWKRRKASRSQLASQLWFIVSLFQQITRVVHLRVNLQTDTIDSTLKLNHFLMMLLMLFERVFSGTEQFAIRTLEKSVIVLPSSA